MSKTFTSRPSNVSQRGRGRGRAQPMAEEAAPVVGTGISPSRTTASTRATAGGGAAAGYGRGGGGGASRGRGTTGDGGRGQGQRTNPGMKGTGGGKINASSRSTLEERTMYAGGFTVIRPDEKRRQDVAKQAEKESQQYEEYKKQNKPSSFSYVGTAGGGEGVSLTEARQQQIRTQAQHSKASRLVREQERRSQQRQEENRALADRKDAARKQTSHNMQRQKDKPENWKSEMNRVNQAFLDRLEAQSKQNQNGPSSGET